MQAKRGADVAEPRPSSKAGLADPDRMKLALDIVAPEFQKPVQLREIRGNIEPLPDEALQQIGMIGEMVDDLRGRQSIIAQRLLVVAHLHALAHFRPIRSKKHARSIDPLQENEAEQIISSLSAGLLPGRQDASLEAITRGVR